MVFEAADIREWRGHSVVDTNDHKIGELEAIYVDTATDEAAFATVKIGLPTRQRLVFAPLAGATVGPGYVRVATDKRLVRSGPHLGTDGELLAANEPAVFEHFKLEYRAGAGGERRLARR